MLKFLGWVLSGAHKVLFYFSTKGREERKPYMSAMYSGEREEKAMHACYTGER
jgi:hypothetical protein